MSGPLTFNVDRDTYTAQSTTGLLSIGGVFFCYTLEPPRGVSIPAGTYPVTLYPSPKFGRIMPLLVNVPGHSYVEIHWGNFPRDTEDCVMVGESRAPDEIGQSREAFAALFPLIEQAVKDPAVGCQIVITDKMPVTDPELGL